MGMKYPVPAMLKISMGSRGGDAGSGGFRKALLMECRNSALRRLSKLFRNRSKRGAANACEANCSSIPLDVSLLENLTCRQRMAEGEVIAGSMTRAPATRMEMISLITLWPALAAGGYVFKYISDI